jgi:diguanylate cyclase (GGDEF)-like protein
VLVDTEGANASARVLLVGDDTRAATMMVEMLRDGWPDGLLITHAPHVTDAARELVDHPDSVVLLHLAHAEDGLPELRALVTAAPEAAIIIVSESEEATAGVAAVTAGAQDHLLRGELYPAMLHRAVRYALERKRAEVRLTRQALQDPLTGLPNRVLFLDRLSVALDRSRRTGLAPAVMFLDIDSFKAVNDTLGHAVGDRLLCALAERFGALLRPMDTVARLGGDEFTFLFEGLSGREEAVVIARRIADSAAEPIALGIGQGQTSVAVSIGVAMLDDPQVVIDDALADADAAMYRAKSLGGGRAELFDTDVDPDRERPGREGAGEPGGDDAQTTRPSPAAASPLDAAALRRALDEDQLRVHYQPRVSIDGRTDLEGFEALLRWNHPDLGLMAPAEFIGLAEDSGLVVEIGDWVIAQALSQIRRWRQTRPGMTMSVNLSRRQLVDPDLTRRLRAQLRDGFTDPGVLCLEVDESAIVDDPAAAAAALADLHEVGIRLAMDRFGRDPASTPSVRDLPFDMLKIDRSVISRLHGSDSDSDEALVETVVRLGHELGMSVVAGGVETDHQLAQVRDLGCDGAQGFLFSRPVPEESVAEMLGAT